jgi:hypothetical protein
MTIYGTDLGRGLRAAISIGERILKLTITGANTIPAIIGQPTVQLTGGWSNHLSFFSLWLKLACQFWHGKRHVQLWGMPADEPRRKSTSIYMGAHDNRRGNEQSLSAFVRDPLWRQEKAKPEAKDRPVTVESIFVNPLFAA